MGPWRPRPWPSRPGPGPSRPRKRLELRSHRYLWRMVRKWILKGLYTWMIRTQTNEVKKNIWQFEENHLTDWTQTFKKVTFTCLYSKLGLSRPSTRPRLGPSKPRPRAARAWCLVFEDPWGQGLTSRTASLHSVEINGHSVKKYTLEPGNKLNCLADSKHTDGGLPHLFFSAKLTERVVKLGFLNICLITTYSIRSSQPTSTSFYWNCSSFCAWSFDHIIEAIWIINKSTLLLLLICLLLLIPSIRLFFLKAHCLVPLLLLSPGSTLIFSSASVIIKGSESQVFFEFSMV